MNARNRIKFRRGDSIIEVLLAVAIFSAIAVTSIAIMNKGLATAESSLETTIVRTEFDAQAEAIRFIKQSYESNAGEPFGTGSSYQTIWKGITNNALDPNDTTYSNFKAAISPDNTTCPTNTDLSNYYPFVIDVTDKTVNTSITTTSSIPSAESGGLWVVAVKDSSAADRKKINYYDFYISACWDDLSSSMPAWRTTIIRLMNPDHEAVTSTPTTISKSVYVTLKAGNNPTNNTPFASVDFVDKNNGNTLASASEYKIAACNASWDSSEAPKTNQECTLEGGDINVVAKTNGFTFNGWDYKKITFKYGCTADSCTIKNGTIKAYKNGIESSISGTTAAFTAQWKKNPTYALILQSSVSSTKYTDSSGSVVTSPLSGNSSTGSSSFDLPKASATGNVFMNWSVGGTTQNAYSTISVTDTDGSCTVGSVKYDHCKTANANWKTQIASTVPAADLHQNKNGQKLLSITIRYNCVKFGLICRSNTEKMRIIYPQIIDSGGNVIGKYGGGTSNGLITSYDDLTSTTSNEDKARLIESSGSSIGKNYIKKLDDTLETQLVINTTALSAGEYTIQLHDYHNPYDSSKGFFNGIKVYIQSWGSDTGDGLQVCNNGYSTSSTWCNPITPTGFPTDSQDWNIFKIRKNSDGSIDFYSL